MIKPKILAFAGSTRKDSFNKKLLKIAAAEASAAGADVTLIDLKDFSMPVYDGDLEAQEGLPENAGKLKELFLSNDGLLLACPEYNSSISGVLKNTIDWVSRPSAGEAPLACFTGKVAAVMSASPGALGGLRGLVHVRAMLENIQVLVLPGQVSIPKAHEAFNPAGGLKDADRQIAVNQLGRDLADTIKKLKS